MGMAWGRLAIGLLLVGAILGGASGTRAADMSGAFSIVARDPATGEIGVAVLSHAPACGNTVPWVEAGVGAIATQGETNASWGPRGLRMLRDGVAVDRMVDSLMHSDDGFQRRQIGALDKTGWPGGYSGIELVNWSGGILDTNLAVQGNTMFDNLVIMAIADTVARLRTLPLADRMLAGLALGHSRRADWRGARSAAILIGRPHPDRPEDATRYVYLRVDDDPDPVAELARLYRAWRASRLVAAEFDYAAWYRKSGDIPRADAEQKRARGDVLAAVNDTTLGAPALNALAWQLAQRGLFLDYAWRAIERARLAEPRSTEFSDTAAEVRYRQGRVADALALAREGSKRVPPDEYLQARVKFFEQEPAKPGGKKR